MDKLHHLGFFMLGMSQYYLAIKVFGDNYEAAGWFILNTLAFVFIIVSAKRR